MHHSHPIPIRNLLENFWVFAAYGIVIAIVLGSMSSFNLDVEKVQDVMMEPFSIYSFSILSLVGLLALCIANITTAKTGAQMRASWWVRNIWVPIANAGLSTGSIITGMLFGLGIGMFGYSYVEPEAFEVFKVLWAVAVYTLALLYPLVWMTRSLFDETKGQKKLSNYVGIFYCISLAIILWFVDKEKFWNFIGIMTIFSFGFSLFLWWLRKRNKTV